MYLVYCGWLLTLITITKILNMDFVIVLTHTQLNQKVAKKEMADLEEPLPCCIE